LGSYGLLWFDTKTVIEGPSDFGNNDFHEEPVSDVPEDNIDDVRRMMEDHNDDLVKAEQTRNEGKRMIASFCSQFGGPTAKIGKIIVFNV
jgi:hypothetical protein